LLAPPRPAPVLAEKLRPFVHAVGLEMRMAAHHVDDAPSAVPPPSSPAPLSLAREPSYATSPICRGAPQLAREPSAEASPSRRRLPEVAREPSYTTSPICRGAPELAREDSAVSSPSRFKTHHPSVESVAEE
jgi:hypothetical protein